MFSPGILILIMKNILLFWFVFITVQTGAQERFFEFLPGWRNYSIIEKDTGYYSVGFSSIGFSEHIYQFSFSNHQGNIEDSWSFNIDSASVTSSMGYTQGLLTLPTSNYITGLAVGGTSEKVFGTLIEFDEKFQDTIQTVIYDLSLDTRMELIIKNSSGNLIVAGEQEPTLYNYYPYLYEMDLQGNILWTKSFSCGTDCELFPNHILQASDGGYFFTCAEVHFNDNLYVVAEKTAIIKTDSLGNEQYRLHPGQPDLFAVRGWVLPTDDGNYITAYSDPMQGVLDENTQVNPDRAIWLQKFDINGEEIFDISLINFLPLVPGFDDGYPYTISQMISAYDDIIVVGYTGLEGFILKVNQNGEGIWFRIITPPQSEGNDAGGEYTRIYSVTQTSDNGYIMAGEYFSSPGNIYPEGIQTAIAVKVDEYGCLEPGCQIGDAVPELTKVNLGLLVYPNPATETVNISVAENLKVEKVRVYEVMGRVVLEKRMAENKIMLDIGDLSPGIYLIEVETKDGLREVKRIVIE